MKPHVADAVDAELARKYPPGVRLLLDLARSGKCGEHEPDERLARVAQTMGEWNEDRASSGAFLDLAYALRNLSGDHASQGLCASALADAWRSEYPFRKPREGDPLDVLVPQLDDVHAVRALDRARALPRPPVSLAELARKVSERWEKRPVQQHDPFDRALGLALLAEAESELEESGAQDMRFLERRRQDAIEALSTAQEWLHQPVVRYRDMLPKVDRTYDHAVSTYLSQTGAYALSPEKRERLARLDEAFHHAVTASGLVVGRWNDTYMRKYDTAKKLTDAYAQKKPGFPDPTGEKAAKYQREVEEIEALFPGVELGLSAD